MEFVGTTWVTTFSSLTSFLISSPYFPFSFTINYSLQNFDIIYQCLHPLYIICSNSLIKLNFLKGSPPFLHQWILTSISVAPNLSFLLSMLLNETHTVAVSLKHYTLELHLKLLDTPFNWLLMYYICQVYISILCASILLVKELSVVDS